MMSASRLIAVALGSVLIGFGLSQVRAQSDHMPLPEEFINRAAVAGIYEVKAARIALNNAQNAELKTFAATMIKDHTEVSDELRAVAGDFPIPTALDSAHQELIDQLNAATSADFDRLYWQQQTEAPKEAVSLFTQFSTGGANGAVKGFAAKNLPILQHHQEMLGGLEATVSPAN
jgi:putative membrane protein